MTKLKPKYTFGPVELNAEGERFLEELRDLHNPGGHRMVIRYNGKQSGRAVGYVKRADADAFRVYFEPNPEVLAREREFEGYRRQEHNSMEKQIEGARVTLRDVLSELDVAKADYKVVVMEMEKAAGVEADLRLELDTCRRFQVEAESKCDRWYADAHLAEQRAIRAEGERNWHRRMAVLAWVIACFAIVVNIVRATA